MFEYNSSSSIANSFDSSFSCFIARVIPVGVVSCARDGVNLGELAGCNVNCLVLVVLVVCCFFITETDDSCGDLWDDPLLRLVFPVVSWVGVASFDAVGLADIVRNRKNLSVFRIFLRILRLLI